MPGPLHSGRLSGLQGVVSPVVSIGFAGPSPPRGAQAPACLERNGGGGGVRYRCTGGAPKFQVQALRVERSFRKARPALLSILPPPASGRLCGETAN